MLLTGDFQYLKDIEAFFKHQPVFALIFQKHDDQLWVCLTFLRAAEVAAVHDPKRLAPFLRRAKFFYWLAKRGWDEKTCGGGMRWGQGSNYKNAITTELFISASIRMYEAIKDKRMLQAAIRGWVWFKMSGMINEQGLVNDGLDDKCKYFSMIFVAYSGIMDR